MKQRNERTSLRLGRIAARVLAQNTGDCRWWVYSVAEMKALAASCLTQLPDKVKRKIGVK